MSSQTRRRIVFLCSGGGGNLRFVHAAISHGWLRDAQVCAVLSDRACAANEFAAARNIETAVIALSRGEQAALAAQLARLQPDLIVTTVHKILGPELVDRYRGRLINLHYSLLPAFGGVIGMRALQAALAYGARFAGVTAHHVDESVDGGRPIVQGGFALRAREHCDEALMNLMFRCGCLALTSALDHLIGGQADAGEQHIDLCGRTCWFSGGTIIPAVALHDEAFWARIAQNDATPSPPTT